MKRFLFLSRSLRISWICNAAVTLSLLAISSTHAIDTDPIAREIDSLKQVLRKTEEDTARVNLYINLANAYLKVSVDSAFFFSEKALAVSQEISYPAGIVKSKDKLAQLDIQYGNPDQAILYLNESLQIAKQMPDALRQHIYRRMGSAYKSKGQYTLSLRHYQKALLLSEKISDTITLAATFHDIGVIYSRIKDLSSAITFYRQALPIYLRLDRYDALFAIYSNMGLAYDQKKGYDSAQYYYQRALRAARTDGSKTNEVTVLNNIAHSYANARQYATALPYAQQAYAIHTKTTPGRNNPFLEDTMGSIYVGLGQYKQARVHYNKALTVLKGYDNVPDYIDVYTNLVRLDSLEGQFQQAFVHQYHLTTLKDSLSKAEKTKVVEEFKVQYETEQKDQEITLLQAQTDRQQLEASQQRFVTNSFIAGSVGLLLLLGLGYNRYRFKQRALGVMQQQNEEIQAQKERVERKHQENQLLLKEVHHRVKNNLQIVLSILNAQADSLRDPVTTAAIRESQHRVHSMALIHQSLYQSDDLSQIQAQQYLHEMVETVYQSYRSEARPVRLRLQIEDVPMDMSTAVPVGLIVTELVTNACKYGLAAEASELSVRLRAETATQYRLTVADNGPGLPPDFDLAQSDSLGLQLVQGLAQQLDGELVVQNRSGACFELLFQRAA